MDRMPGRATDQRLVMVVDEGGGNEGRLDDDVVTARAPEAHAVPHAIDAELVGPQQEIQSLLDAPSSDRVTPPTIAHWQ